MHFREDQTNTTFSSHGNTTLKLNSTSLDWTQDIASDLDIFVRLSKAGHYKRAMDFFAENLSQYIAHFPVAAEYADSLVDQGAFGEAADFLTETLGAQPDRETLNCFEETELAVLRSLLELTRVHTELLSMTALHHTEHELQRRWQFEIELLDPVEASSKSRLNNSCTYSH
jgi:hypothetical protein